MPGLASFIYGLFVHRLPLLSLQEYLTRGTNFQSNNLSPDQENSGATCWNLPPPVWPHSLKIVQHRVPDDGSKVSPATTITYYNYDLGANLIQIIPEGDEENVLWDLELDTGHSFYFTPSTQTCNPIDFPVGILRPDWLEGATPLGPSKSWDGSRVVCGWTKLDFVDYYADPTTLIPDYWYFHNMKASFPVLNYTEDPTIEPGLFLPPNYCAISL